MASTASIAVVGVGAIGGAMASALGDAGHRPTLCMRTPITTLRRTLDGETRSYDFPVVTGPAGMVPADWVLLSTKTYHLSQAAPWLDALVGPDTRIAVMQNGVDHRERVAQYVPPERAVPCIILLPARVESRGHVTQERAGVIEVPDDASGRALAALFAGQTVARVEPTADFVTAIWKKLVINAVGGAICCPTLTPLAGVASERVRALATGLIEEVAAVGRAEGAVIPEDIAARTIEYFGGPVGTHWTSIAQDRREGRRMEWDARNAVVGRIGRRHGIPTPLNDAVTQLLALADTNAD